MKALLLILTAALTAPWLFAAEPSQNDSVFPSVPKLHIDEELVQKDGFSARFSLIDDEQFFLTWMPGSSACLPNVTKAKRNRPVYVSIFFADPAVRSIRSLVNPKKSTITTDITFDFEVRKADGSYYGGGKALQGWSGRPPSFHMVQLARTHAEIKFEAIDPVGMYTIDVIVRDNIRKVAIALERKILLED